MDLRQREQYQRALLDNFPFMVWLKDEASRFLAVNQTFASQYGMDAQSMVGMNDDDIATPEFAQAYRADDLEVLRSGISKQVDELIDTGGQHEWFETYKSPIKVDGRAIGTVGFARNITPRKLIEAELMAAKAEAEQANRAKSRFLAAASHDLRQPLTALSLLVGLLKTRMTSDSAGVVSKIQSCIDSLSELLTDLLDVSKLEAGVVKPKVTDIALDALLANLVSVYATEAEAKGLRLRTRQTQAVGRTDPQLLRRILGNFIANAIRYTDQGGVLVSCRRHQDKFWIEVWDTGIGIEADKTGIIFEEFRQLGDESRNRGSGLGLAIVAKAAALLGLKIRVQSRPGRGSLFAIEVPVGAPIPLHESTPTEPVPRALRIGVVDDNILVLNALTMALESEGHDVVAATTGPLLIEQLADRQPDIVISDYRLADGATGFDVITALRNCFTEALPVLLITGDTAPSLVRSMAERGIAVHYKPLNMDALCSAIRQATHVNPS
jgi:PAS domain S-box-containing protein